MISIIHWGTRLLRLNKYQWSDCTSNRLWFLFLLLQGLQKIYHSDANGWFNPWQDLQISSNLPFYRSYQNPSSRQDTSPQLFDPMFPSSYGWIWPISTQFGTFTVEFGDTKSMTQRKNRMDKRPTHHARREKYKTLAIMALQRHHKRKDKTSLYIYHKTWAITALQSKRNRRNSRNIPSSFACQ